MKYFEKKTIFKYLYDQLTGNFAGFLVGMSATGLVSNFFETRSVKNLWGITSKKTVVDKETFQNIEWAISIIIGFIVFEVVTKVIKHKLDTHMPLIKRIVFRFIIQRNLKEKTNYALQFLINKRITFLSAVNTRIKTTVSKYSKG